MKKHTIVLLLLIALALITVVIQLIPKENEVTVEIVEGSVTNRGVEIQITDNSRGVYSWGGPHYDIEVKEIDEWKQVEPKRVVIVRTVAFTLDKNHQLNLNISWLEDYGELPKGTYRLKMIAEKFNQELNQAEEKAFYSNEFEIK